MRVCGERYDERGKYGDLFHAETGNRKRVIYHNREWLAVILPGTFPGKAVARAEHSNCRQRNRN